VVLQRQEAVEWERRRVTQKESDANKVPRHNVSIREVCSVPNETATALIAFYKLTPVDTRSALQTAPSDTTRKMKNPGKTGVSACLDVL
jgi:hypothetical protein